MYTQNEKIVPVYIEEEIKDSYLNYAMSVIVGRALPDVRDGLKPVHRRILYAMQDLGLEHTKPYKKCARVTGEVLGKYHPHGDIAVYDALVRMAQDFSLRYPLVEGQGNFGSIDGDAAAAMRYCVAGDTLIVTDKGLYRIDEVPHHSETDFKVLSLNNKINSVSKWFDSGEHLTKKISTFRGFSLIGSLNHPILVWQKNGLKPKLTWKLLNQVKVGDYAVISRGDPLFPIKEPSLKQFYPKIRKRAQRHRLPSSMNEDLAFILGAIISEGSISKKHIDFCNGDTEFLKKFKRSFQKVFPDCRLHEFVREPLGFGKKNCTYLEIHSTQAVDFLKNLGLHPCRAFEKSIPKIIFISSKRSTAAFIKGYAEGDGSICIGKRNPDISLVSTSEKLIQGLQILLLRFGIDSSYRLHKQKNYFRLFIRSHINLNLFKKQINFATKKSCQRLTDICRCNSNGWVMSKMDFVPYFADYIRSKITRQRRKFWGHIEWLKKHNIDRYPKIEKIWPKLKRILDKEDIYLLETLRNSRYIFDKITSAEDSGKKRVYSIKVNSSCHSFVSNGFISHNTEARLDSIADEMLADIDKDTVNFMPNFDASLTEPTVLPARLPNLLINGSSGIAVGMATNMPPHNLNEVVDGIVYTLENPECEPKELMRYIKGPDFPTGGLICGREGIKGAYLTGKGKITLRGRASIERQKGGKDLIVVTEIPYQVNKSLLIESIANLVEEKKIEGISDIRDESAKEGVRMVLELKRDSEPQIVLNQLFKHTQLEVTFGIINLALVEGRPRVLNIKQIIAQYILHRKEIIRRRTLFDLDKTQKRAHILEGLKIALQHIDKIIKTIKTSKNTPEAKERLMKEFGLSDAQAQAILEMQLQRLTALERDKIDAEYLDLIKKIELYKSILASEKKIEGIIKEEILELKKKYGDERRTEVVGEVEEIDIEDLIVEEDMVVTISHGGYIKRLSVSVYRKQRRGGKGVTAMETREEDFVRHLFIASTKDYLLVFTNKGKVYWLKAYEVPEAARSSKGKAIVNLLSLASDELVAAVVTVKEFSDDRYLVMCTKRGLIKKTRLSTFSNPRKAGIVAITLDKDDQLIQTSLTDGKQEILLATKEGKSVRFEEEQVRDMGRQAKGVRGMRLGKKDEIMGMEVVPPESKKLGLTLLTVTSGGFAKRSDFEEYRLQSRGGKGIINIKVAPKIGTVVGVCSVSEDDEVMTVTKKAMMVRCAIKDIRKTGRNTQGVRLISMDKDDAVASLAKVVAKED